MKGADKNWSDPLKLTWGPLFLWEQRKRVQGHALTTLCDYQAER